MSLIQGVKGDSAVQARSLYRQLLRQSEQFAAYNFREYAKRRTRDAFREHKGVQEPRAIQELVQKGLKELQMMKRQTVISQFYQLDRLVVEGGKTGKQTGKRNDIVRQKDTGIFVQYGGAPCERKGLDLNPLDSESIPDSYSTTASYLEPVNLFTRIPLATQKLQDLVNNLFPPTPNAIMAPGYRANNQSRRANRSYVDHDVFEGLPVRNWRRDTVMIAPPPVHEISAQKDKWDVELPWGMPKDSHLLPQHSQDLLRAARSGRLYVRRLPMEEEEVDAEANSGDKPEKKKEDPKEKGFPIKTWKLVPKHQEGPEIEFLAKRRKGLMGTAVSAGPTSGSTMTKARVRRTDAAGNTYVEDVVIAEGQALEGELISQTVIVDSAVGKSAVDTVQALPTPPRRRPPPPKRKAKGPGRGRKRKLPLAPTSVTGETGNIQPETESENTGVQDKSLALEGIKREDSETANAENENEDVEMGDDDEGEDGSDEDDQSEGDGQGDHDGEDIEHTEAKHPELARTETNESADTAADDHGGGQDHERDVSSSPEVPLATIGSAVAHEHGSPLRNVVTFTSAFEDRSPDLISDGEAEAEGEEDEVAHNDIHQGIQAGMENRDMQEPYHMREHDGYSTENIGDDLQMEQSQNYMDDDEMLLDGDMSGMEFGNMPVGSEQYPESYPDDDDEEEVEEIMPIPVQGPQDQISHPDQQNLEPEPQFPAQDSINDQTGLVPSDVARQDEEDNFEDLLGSLEDHLNEQRPGPEVERIEEITEPEDKATNAPNGDQFDAAVPASMVVLDVAVHQPQDEELKEKVPVEGNGNIMDSRVDVESKEVWSEEAERHVPEPGGQE